MFKCSVVLVIFVRNVGLPTTCFKYIFWLSFPLDKEYTCSMFRSTLARSPPAPGHTGRLSCSIAACLFLAVRDPSVNKLNSQSRLPTAA